MHPEPPPPKLGYTALRHHRWSAAGAEYFVTINLKRPAHGLTDARLLAALQHHIETLEAEALWSVRTSVVMPDHAHLLFTLGSSATLPECLRLFKGRLSPALRERRLAWQNGYFEHQMRAEEDCLPVFLYLFLNPYRAKLVPASRKWPGYSCAAEDWAWFCSLTNSDVPFPEWLE